MRIKNPDTNTVKSLCSAWQNKAGVPEQGTSIFNT